MLSSATEICKQKAAGACRPGGGGKKEGEWSWAKLHRGAFEPGRGGLSAGVFNGKEEG